jgi:hypothetical protein
MRFIVKYKKGGSDICFFYIVLAAMIALLIEQLGG